MCVLVRFWLKHLIAILGLSCPFENVTGVDMREKKAPDTLSQSSINGKIIISEDLRQGCCIRTFKQT